MATKNRKAHVLKGLKVVFTCGKHGKEVEALVSQYDFSTIGGCTGHPDGDYCYCFTPEIRVGVTCPECKVYYDFLVKEGN